MKRQITVHVMGNTILFNAETEDDEQNIRKAAKALDAIANELYRNRLGITDAEVGRIVALNIGIESEKLKKEILKLNAKINGLHAEIEGLHKNLESYLDKIDKI